MEKFKDIPGLEKKYQVSNLGNVKSLKRYVKHNSGGLKVVNERILRYVIKNRGYKHVVLMKNGKHKGYYIHQLVAMAFLGHTPNGHKLVVDHINEDKLDNRVENLQLISNKENVIKSIYA